MMRLRLLAGGAALAVLIAGCSPVISTHGYAPPQAELETIVPGQDTRGSVRRKVGRPGMNGVFTDDSWYYVATTIERLAYKEPRVIDRRVVAISFDQTDVVTAINTYGLEDGRIVDLETDTTPTRGNRLTVLQQILGNFGNVDAGEILNDVQ